MAQAGPLPAAVAAALGPLAIVAQAPTTYRDYFAAEMPTKVYHPSLNANLPDAQLGPAMNLPLPSRRQPGSQEWDHFAFKGDVTHP